MTRLLVVIAVALPLGAACGKDAPPPSPPGCAQAKTAFEKIESGFAMVAKKTADMDKDAYCTRLQGGVSAANALSFALFAESLGEGAKAKAAGLVRHHTKGLLAGASAVSKKCAQDGVSGTQAALAVQLAKARAAVNKSCSE